MANVKLLKPFTLILDADEILLMGNILVFIGKIYEYNVTISRSISLFILPVLVTLFLFLQPVYINKSEVKQNIFEKEFVLSSIVGVVGVRDRISNNASQQVGTMWINKLHCCNACIRNKYGDQCSWILLMLPIYLAGSYINI